MHIINLPKIKDVAVRCPVCGEPSLHQREVEVFFRDSEDDIKGEHVTVKHRKTHQDTAPTEEDPFFGGTDFRNQDGNPSPRRDGLRIVFDCECCDGVPYLVIYQHKGVTYIQWETYQKRIPFDGE